MDAKDQPERLQSDSQGLQEAPPGRQAYQLTRADTMSAPGSQEANTLALPVADLLDHAAVMRPAGFLDERLA